MRAVWLCVCPGTRPCLLVSEFHVTSPLSRQALLWPRSPLLEPLHPEQWHKVGVQSVAAWGIEPSDCKAVVIKKRDKAKLTLCCVLFPKLEPSVACEAFPLW